MINSIHSFQARASFGHFPKAIVFVTIHLLALMFGINSYSQTPVTFTSSGTWTCPAGVTSVTVECWGAGGGGGQRTSNGASGGGGGGAYASGSVSVIPGNNYTITVGAGGSGSTGTKNGGHSSFASSVIALGGGGAANNATTLGAGGLASGSTGTIRRNGGNGATGATNSGAGGGAAGRTDIGNGINNGGLYGGNGGASQASQGNGNAGLIYGGGGSGGKRTSSGTRTGGNGANGLVVITYNDAIWQNPVIGTGISSASTYTTGDLFTSNVTVSGISKAGAADASTNDAYRATGWTGGSINTGNYFQFTITPTSGYALNLSSFTYSGSTGHTGLGNAPSSFALRSSLDGYASNIGTASSSAAINLSSSEYQYVSSSVTFRIYAWGGSTFIGGAPYFQIDDFIFRGSVTPIVAPTITTFLPTVSCPNSGEEIIITGTEFYGVTAVKFNGVDASFTVNSPTEISANLPTGATNGNISVTTPGGTAYSSASFTLYEGSSDIVLLSANFDNNNIGAWTQGPQGGWSASNSSPIDGSRSLVATASSAGGSDGERWISTPLTGSPINMNDGEITWRFNALPELSGAGFGVASADNIFVWLTSNSADVHVNSVYGYGVLFNNNQIQLGLRQGNSWTSLVSYNAGFGLTGVEVIRSAAGVWEFRTDANGGFDNLVLRGTATNTTITTAGYFGAFIDNPIYIGIGIASMSLKLDNVDIIQEGECHEIYYSQTNGNSASAIWHRERTGGTPVVVNGEEHISFVIQNGHAVIPVSADWTLEHLTIEAGGSINFSTSGGTSNVKLSGNLDNQGTVVSNLETLTFEGEVNQQVTSHVKLVLNNIVVNNGHALTLPSNVDTEIKPLGVVSIPSGTLTTNNRLILSSRPTGTGSIGTIGSGSSVSGQVTLERFIPDLSVAPLSGNGSWVAVGTPITGAIVQQWNETVITTGFAGADFGPAQNYYFNNIQWYNESATGAINNGYTGVTSLSETLQSKRGYFFYTYANLPVPQNLLRVKGNIQQGTFNDTLQYTNNGVPTADGWNLLVNRYPSEVDFKSIAEAGAGGITAYHLFNAETNNYKVYHTNAAGTAPRYIASGQAFFVQATAPNSYLRYQESFKSNQGTAFERDLQESSFAAIKFYKAQNNEDECVLNFNDNATANFENEYDAVKLHSQEPTVAECAFVSADGQLMSIDSRPLGQDAAITIPIYVEMPVSGTYRLRIEQINNLPFGSCLFVEDLVTGNTMPFEEGQELVIVHTGNYSGNRFLIHASPSITVAETNLDCYEAGNGSIALTLPEGEWTLSLADTLGNSYAMSETVGMFENLAAGQYIASATNALSNCAVSNKTVTITEPAEMVLTHLNSIVDECNASSNAVIEWAVSNATNYDYVVTNQANEIVSSGNAGSGAVMVDGLTAGIYTVNVETYCGTQSFETNLNDTNTVSTQILSDDILIPLVEGTSQTLSVEQSSTNATSYLWMLSDGNNLEEETFNYEFDTPGNYLLKLYAYNNQCVAQDSIAIFVDQVVSISEDGTPAPISFFQTKDSFELYLNLSSQERTRVSVIDLSGREVWAMNTSTQPGKNISIGTGAFASGVYFLRTTVGNEEILNKKFINP